MLLPLYLNLRPDEGYDGLGVGFGADYVDAVAEFKLGLAVRHAYVAVVEGAGAHELAVEEVVDLLQRAACEV